MLKKILIYCLLLLCMPQLEAFKYRPHDFFFNCSLATFGLGIGATLIGSCHYLPYVKPSYWFNNQQYKNNFYKNLISELAAEQNPNHIPLTDADRQEYYKTHTSIAENGNALCRLFFGTMFLTASLYYFKNTAYDDYIHYFNKLS